MDGQTSLRSVALPQLDVVLEEIFHVPPAALFPEVPRPTTVSELAAGAGLTVVETRRRLMDLERVAKDIEIAPEALQALLAGPGHGGVILLDVREAWEYAICRLPGAILLTEASFQTLKPKLAEAALVVTICHHGVRSFSAAMFLREQGIHAAKSLAGGLDLWARTVDPGMARY